MKRTDKRLTMVLEFVQNLLGVITWLLIRMLDDRQTNVLVGSQKRPIIKQIEQKSLPPRGLKRRLAILKKSKRS